MANHKDSQPKAVNAPGKGVTVKPEWGSAKRRSYFNTFDLDRTSEKGFVLCRFAFVRWGECVDCTTVLIPELVINNAQQSFLSYVKDVGLGAVDYESKIPDIPRFQHGIVEIADIINLGRSDNIGEIALHGFSIPYLIEATKSGITPAPPEFIAILRSSLSLQIKWVVSLYAKS
jgi:hypothetical protein